MLGAGHGRSEQRHLPSAYISVSGRLDTGIVPKLYHADWSIPPLGAITSHYSMVKYIPN
jgi:hypothetical protein